MDDTNKRGWLVFIDDLERAVEDPARVFTDENKKDFDKNNKNNAPFEQAKRDIGRHTRRRRRMPWSK